MVELKTLKDFAIEWGDGFGVVRKDQLRQEAIKWIKELEKVSFTNPLKDGDYKVLDGDIWEGEQQPAPYIIEYIKHFFNITDEELK